MINNFYPKPYGRIRGRIKKNSLIRYKSIINNYLFKGNVYTKRIIIEIGSGNGEHAINLSKIYPDKLIIACDVYIDGNASLINKIKKNNISNIKIYNKNCFLLFEKINKLFIDEIWILYPDPWPKKRHYKRRLINKLLINYLYDSLDINGKIYIATDDQKYFLDIMQKFYFSKLFSWENDRPVFWSQPFHKMAETSFFKKAQINSQKSYFIIFKKII